MYLLLGSHRIQNVSTSVRGTPKKYNVLKMPGRRRPKKLDIVMNSSSEDTAPRKKVFSEILLCKKEKIVTF